jgi:hypothetical protein
MTGRTGDATAAAITQAAAHLLARHEDPTVGAVAQATGVARGTIYRCSPPAKPCSPPSSLLDEGLELSLATHSTRNVILCLAVAGAASPG